MKRLLKSLTLALVAVVLISSAVLAYSYSASIIVTESGSDSYGMLPIIVSVNNTYLADNNFISASGLDTRVLKSSTELPHMLADNKTLFASPISASTQEGFTYTLGNSNLTSFPIITGYGGYITTADNSSLEPGNNFTIEVSGYVNTDNGIDKNIVYKENTFRTYVSGDISGNIISGLPGAGFTWVDPTGHNTDWTNPANAYDTLTATYAEKANGGAGWTTYIELTHTAILCNNIRYWYTDGGGTSNNFEVDIFYDGGWHNIYTGAATLGAWTTVSISPIQEITSVRFRASAVAGLTAYLHEVDFGEVVWVEVTAAGVLSGNHVVLVSANTTHLAIAIDGVTQNSTLLGGVTTNNSTYNWITCSANTTPWLNYISENVSGVEVLRYQPNNIIQGTVLPNRASGGDYGAITWGANPSGIAVVVGGLLPVTAVVGVSEAQESTFVPSVSVDMQTTGTEGTNFPLYGLFKSLLNDFNRLRVYQDTKQSLGYEPSQAELDVAVAGSKHITMANFWKLVAVIIGWSVGTAVLLMTKNVVIGLVGYLVGFVVPTYFMSILDVWVPIVYGIGAVCLAALLWKWTSSSVG